MSRLHPCPSCRCAELDADPPAVIDVRAPGAALVLELDRIVREEQRARQRATLAGRLEAPS